MVRRLLSTASIYCTPRKPFNYRARGERNQRTPSSTLPRDMASVEFNLSLTIGSEPVKTAFGSISQRLPSQFGTSTINNTFDLSDDRSAIHSEV